MAEAAEEIITTMDADLSTPRSRGRRFYFPLWASEVADIHGLKHVMGRGSRLRRLIWLAILLISVFIFGLQIYHTIENYFRFHHLTKLDVLYDVNIDFPAVTICNLNKYRMSEMTLDDVRNIGRYLGKMYFGYRHSFSG